MPELIQLNISFLIVLLAAILAFSISYFFYRKTNPAIPEYARWILLLLRALVLFLIFLIFFTPTVRLVFFKEQPIKTAVFIDNSKSMSIKDGQSSRWHQVKRIVEQLQNIVPEQSTTWFVFNSQIKPLTNLDSLKLSEGATNLQQVLQCIRQDRYDKSIIISDGIVTDGLYPDVKQRLPGQLFTIPVGKTKSTFDIFIKRVDYPETIYQNEKQKINVYVAVKKLARTQTLNLILKDSKRIIQTKPIHLKKGSGNYQFTVEYKLQQVGLQRLTIEINPLKGENNVENNRFQFVQEVLKSKKIVGLFSAYPNYDHKFLRLSLQKLPRLKIVSFVEDNHGHFLQKGNLNLIDSMDVWCFVDFPTAKSSQLLIQQLAQSWARHKPNLFLLIGKSFEPEQLLHVSSQFPQIRKNKLLKPIALMPIINIDKKATPFINLFDDQQVNQQFWNLLPPLLNYGSSWSPQKEDIVIVESSFRGKLLPLIVLSEQRFKLAVVNGQALWRWHFLLQPNAPIADGYQIFIEKLFAWLSKRQPFKPVFISVDKKSGHIGQKFKIEMQVLDSRSKPVVGSSLVLSVKSKKQSFSLDVQQLSDGKFVSEFVPVRSGSYTLIAKGFKGNQLWGVDSIKIFIVPVNKEMIYSNPDTLFLKQLAISNHGQMINARSLTSLKPFFLQRGKIIRVQKEIELWYKVGLLIMILILITLEWTLRKRWNLI